MASRRNKRKIRYDNSRRVTDRTLFYTDLTSLDPSLKNEMWAAQALFFMRNRAQLFLDPKKAVTYRNLDKLKIDEQVHKELIDPKTPTGEGGTAEYFSADWGANPIYIHLKNIVKADIEKTGKDLEVSMTDKFAKTNQMRENYKILYREAFRNLINRLAEEIGIPGVSKSQDPYKWVENFTSQMEDESEDVVSKYTDLIKNQITDDEDLALFNELIYKGDYEIAFELGIKYYIFNLNKWQERHADEVINDLMHFNKAAGEWYTDLITGRPVIERFAPENLYVSPFRKKDGEDISYYYTEYRISFGEFMRTMGQNLKPETLKEVFIFMRQNNVHAIDWRDEWINTDTPNWTRDNATVLVGRAAMLSQDLEVHMENPMTGEYRRVDYTWKPLNEYENRIEKRYNVWRWWYYIPPISKNADWMWQSKYIFQLQKFQDQQRYGDSGRYAKPPLVIYDNSSQATFTDIVQSYMPKITLLWHKYQNYIVNDIDAQIMSEDFIAGLMGAVDEENGVRVRDKKTASGTNQNAYLAQWRMIKQVGTGFLKMTDSSGKPMLDPQKMLLSVKNNYLDKAEKTIVQMMMLYDLMIKSLAYSPMTAGEEIKPRTPVAALEQTLKATNSARFFIQKAYEEFLVMFGERMIRYIVDIAREKHSLNYPYRWQEFLDNIGYANGLAIENMKDIDPESIGITVNYVDNQSKKEFIMELALQYIKNKELSDEFLYLIIGVDNWKYAYMLMRLAIKKRKREIMEEQAIDHERKIEVSDRQFAMLAQMEQLKIAGKDQNIITQGKIDQMVEAALNSGKYQAQSQLKKETSDLRQMENRQKSDLEKEKEALKTNLEQQLPIQ